MITFKTFCKSGKLFVSFLIVALSLMGMIARAAEHPSEHPADEGTKVTVKTLAKAIKNYVKKDAKLKGGYFLIYDSMEKQALVLTLDKVHEDRLSSVGNGVYFACADFKTHKGVMYDLDIFMKEDDHGLEVTEITIHKKNDKARYNWVEEKGMWKRKEIDKK
ncbi:MAG: hypothetical protein AB1546_12890 [bacterium]